MKIRTETVSFRADADLLRLMDAECQQFGISRGSWARGVVIAHLHRTESNDASVDLGPLQLKLDGLEQLVDLLKTDLTRSLYFILTRVGEMPADEARKLIRSKFTNAEG